jgi:hypothetical protein
MRRLPIILSMIAVIVLLAQVTPSRAQTSPQLLADITISDSTNDKYPGIASYNQKVFIAGGVSRNNSDNNTDAVLWTLADQATSIGGGISVGAAAGTPDYSSASVATSVDGSVYVAWSNQNTNRVYMRRMNSDGSVNSNWPVREVGAGAELALFPQIAVAKNSQNNDRVFVIWQGVEAPLTLRVWDEASQSWIGTYTTPDNTYSIPPSITVGPSNQVLIGYATSSLKATVGIWTGSGLTIEYITGTASASHLSVSVGPTGKYYAAWRGLGDAGANSGVYYAERDMSLNTWAYTQLTTGQIGGTVNVYVDSSGTVHLGWAANIGGQRIYYTFRQAGQIQFAATAMSNTTGLINARMAISSEGAYAHLVAENWSGRLRITYARFSGGSQRVSATPLIEGGAAVIARKTSVQVSFSNYRGNPTLLRWRWRFEPDNTNSDSNGWQTLASTMTIAVPDSVLSAATCDPMLLYVQFSNASQTTGPVQSDGIVFDTGVTSAVTLANPHMRNRPTTFSSLDATLNDVGSDGGASDGAAGYTREPQIYVGVDGLSDCSGINTLAIGRPPASYNPIQSVANNNFSNIVPVPGSFPIGSNSVLLRLTDKVGNAKEYPASIIYDPTPPTLSATAPGTLVATPHPGATILVKLVFTNISVNDGTNGYPGRGFWGVWLANSRTPTDPTTDASLIWYPVAAPGSTGTFTIDNWSLASGLMDSQINDGDYYVYARFLDGAGNFTAGAIAAPMVTLRPMTLPKISMPTVKR